MDIRKYNAAYDLESLFEGDISYNESVMFMEQADGSVPDAPLLYRPEEIIQVCSSTCDVEYVEGEDYAVVDGRLRRIPTGRMPLMLRETAYPSQEKEGVWTFRNADGSLIAVADGHQMHLHQVFVTYRHSESWNGFVQPDRSMMIPRTMAALEAGRPVNMMFFGDSITTPANVSGNDLHTPPDMPSWPELAFAVLQERYPHLTYSNTAVGGMSSPWGVDVVLDKFRDTVPDIAVIGFGMNDATGDMPPREFVGNICHIMEKARTLNPNMEFILISTTLANPTATQFSKTQNEHEPLFLALEHTGVAVMQMTSVHAALLERKRFCDMSGNDINHPNDYLSRAYAQTILRLFGIR